MEAEEVLEYRESAKVKMPKKDTNSANEQLLSIAYEEAVILVDRLERIGFAPEDRKQAICEQQALLYKGLLHGDSLPPPSQL